LETAIWKINPVQPEPEIIERAAELIRESQLVAFPTETVYGLGAAAFDPEAAQKIFIAKGRPSQKPLLVHISNREQAASLVEDIPSAAWLLMDKFWPGPLSIILPARESVPAIVRGGGNSVGLRMPAHPVSLALIEKTGPLAAASANISGKPAPVTADQVKEDLCGKIAAVLDAGPTGTGLPSTIIDLTGEEYRILRQGELAVGVLEDVLGEKVKF